jgi:hypothetical protein
MVTPMWCAFNADLEAVMLPTPPVDFLRYRPVKGTMFAERPGSQIKHQTASSWRDIAISKAPTHPLYFFRIGALQPRKPRPASRTAARARAG